MLALFQQVGGNKEVGGRKPPAFNKVKMMIDLQNKEGLEFLATVESNTVDLVLVDPPYIISKDSGMDKWVSHVANQDTPGAKNARTEKQWEKYSQKRKLSELASKDKKYKLETFKKNYLKYGSIYGKKYAVTTDYGKWDSEFTMEQLEAFIGEFYRVLKPGGTCIVFFDLWKITSLKDTLESVKFKQIRFVEWIKTNPIPINQHINYLSNAREIALTAVKKGKPTFNSKYDRGIYEYPVQNGKDKIHKNQKSLPLFEELVLKHTNEGDLVLDCFAGSATTAIACINTDRNFVGCELNKQYYKKASKRVADRQQLRALSSVVRAAGS